MSVGDAPLVYVCFAPDDSSLAAELEQQLQPLIQRSEMRLFSPNSLLPGESLGHTRAAITQTNIYLPLLSPSWLSDQACQERSQIARSFQQRGLLTIVPVLIRNCLADASIFAGLRYLPARGKAIASQRPRDAAWLEVAQSVRSLVQAYLTAPRRTNSRPQPHPLRDGDPRHELNVRLALHNGHLLLRYFVSSGEEVGRAAVPGPVLSPQMLRGLNGADLFDLIFPDEMVWREVLRILFGQQAGEPVHPSFQPVRFRLHAETPAFLYLPLGGMAYHERKLLDDGWTYEVSLHNGADEIAHSHVELPAPCRVAVLRPANDDAHHRDLREALIKIDPQRADFFSQATSPAALCAPCDLLYAHGSVDAAALLPRLRHHPPKIVFLHGVQGEPLRLLVQEIGPLVPLVVEQTDFDPAYALHFVRRCLGDGLDPVRALHEAATRLNRGTLICHSHYGTFSIRRRRSRTLDRFAHLRLDRDQQRALAMRHVKHLMQGRRVEAMIAYGAPGNLVGHFAAQAVDEMEADVRVRHLADLPFPVDRSSLCEALLAELHAYLGAAGVPLRHLLRKQAPSGRAGGDPVLWLDFGVFGEAYGRRLRASELAEWLRFCKDLSGHTPEDLRLVCSLSLEVDPAKFGAIEREVQVLAADLFDETFRCSLLPPLSEVREMDLLNFLSNPTSCNCPSLLVRDVARLIYERTAGGYAATVAMLERAESIGWHRLRDELRGGGPARTLDVDDEL